MGVSRRFLVVLGLLILVASVAAPAIESAESQLQVTKVEVAERAVLVDVANSGEKSAKAVVTVTAMQDGWLTQATAETVISARGTTSVAVEFGGLVEGVITVGIIDDLNPI